MTNTAEIEKKAESIEGVVFADPEQQYYVYPAEIRGAKLRAVKVGGSERGMSDKRMAEEIAKTAGVLASDVLDIIKIIPFELIEANNRGLSTCTLEESYVLDLYNTEGNWLLVAFPEIGNIAISFSLSKCRQKNDNTSKKGGEDKVYNEIEYEKYGRDPRTKRRYGRAWKRIRDKYAAEHPFCELCFERGVIVPTEEIHHKKPLSEGGTHDRSNLIALCKSCHSRIHAERGDRWGKRPEGE